jgi:murein DD-endopeptidase MepM/ murein hydrolase activator NlpD
MRADARWRARASVAAGVVSEVREAHRCGGVHVRNLFRWNSVTVAHADGTHAEYVHTAAGSARVAVGDAVAEGQHIADSGDVGFCPEPHLHLQLHASGATDAPTLRFALRCDAGGGASGASGASFFEPQAGLFYGAGGEAPRPAEEEED